MTASNQPSPEREAFEKWFEKANISDWIEERCFDA